VSRTGDTPAPTEGLDGSVAHEHAALDVDLHDRVPALLEVGLRPNVPGGDSGGVDQHVHVPPRDLGRCDDGDRTRTRADVLRHPAHALRAFDLTEALDRSGERRLVHIRHENASAVPEDPLRRRQSQPRGSASHDGDLALEALRAGVLGSGRWRRWKTVAATRAAALLCGHAYRGEVTAQAQNRFV
jgi:hypothetical protein